MTAAAPSGPRLMALFVLAAGLTVLTGAFLIPEGGGYQAVGPRPFPVLVGAAGTLVGAIGVGQAFRGPRRDRQPARWRPTSLLLLLLIAYALLMPYAGYWQTTSVLYVVAARIQGSRRLRRDALIGFVLAVTTYLLFSRLFGIDLPPGYLRLAL